MPGRKENLALIVKKPAADVLAMDVAAFLSDCELRNLSPNTLRIYRKQLGAFQRWIEPKVTFEITPNDLRAYLLHLRESHNPGVQHQAFRTLHTFFTWLSDEDILERNPMARLRPPKLAQEPLDPLSLSDRRAFALLSLEAGIDVYSLQKLMGHADLSVLRRYLAQTQDDLQQAHQKVAPADRP